MLHRSPPRCVRSSRGAALVIAAVGLLGVACTRDAATSDTAATSPATTTPDTTVVATSPVETVPVETVPVETAPAVVDDGFVPALGAARYDVVVTEDIVYGQGEVGGGGSFIDLRLDLYTPQDTGADAFPLAVVVHGGGFRGGSKGQANVVDWAQGFAARGYLVASIDYRLSGMDPVPSARVRPFLDAVGALGGGVQETTAVAAIDDTLTALDFLLARPDTIDSSTTLVGGSAGAVTVDYVAYALDDFGIERPPIAAVVSNWGGLPFGGDASTFIDESEPPVYLAHADGDPTVPYALSVAIAERSAAIGIDHEFFTKEGDVHAFDLTSNMVAPGVSVLDDQVRWVTCRLFPQVADEPECT